MIFEANKEINYFLSLKLKLIKESNIYGKNSMDLFIQNKKRGYQR